ncbi:hypothetical protein C9374_005708 [Naegleria lovaniensis]|uniref:PARP catalytic domain-containing protein n=1 Tax=Naegleria lovaniensis TaxID=51637 RepID=A0AA88GJ21_NAELO|nr:uncharacterized protein C9374_005708 [Naegleria lovaniensis]KAG2381916.1 hypothetical protein C9374_005708 [Naegleria lovaniensis]
MIQRPRSSSKPTTNTLIDFHALRDPVPLSNLSPRSLSEKLRESTDLSKINFKFLLFEIRVQAKADQAVISTLPTNNSQECHPLCVLFQLQKALATPNDTNTKLLNSNYTMSVEAAPELFIATPEITSHLPLYVLAINTEWSLNSHLDLYFKTVRQVFCEQEQEFFSEQNSSYDFEVMATQIHELLSDRLEKALLKLATRESKAISKSLLTFKGSNHIPVEMDHDEITKLNKELNTNDFTKNVLFSTPTPYNDFHTESVLHLHIPIPQNWESMNDLSTTLVKLKPTSNEYKFVKSLMDTTIQKHKGNVGGEFSQYLIRSITRIQNAKLYVKYFLKSQEYAHEKKQLELYLFHGCPEAVVDTIVE